MQHEVGRTGDIDRDREAWMERTAAILAHLLIEVTGQQAGEDAPAHEDEKAA
jgi:hypothetical protein